MNDPIERKEEKKKWRVREASCTRVIVAASTMDG